MLLLAPYNHTDIPRFVNDYSAVYMRYTVGLYEIYPGSPINAERDSPLRFYLANPLFLADNL